MANVEIKNSKPKANRVPKPRHSTAKIDPLDSSGARSDGDKLWDKAFAETPKEVFTSIISDIRASIH